MRFKTPAFWYQPPEQLPAFIRFLAPIGKLYGSATQIRLESTTPTTVSIPVICIGNLVAGGSGKTPTALAIMSLLKDFGIAKNPCFLTRGYGGTYTGPAFVSSHTFKQVGDEALLLARAAPTIVSQNRVAGANLAASSGHDMIIMDDGFQNPSLHKDASFIVVDGRTGFGNGYMIPIGPLREPVSEGLTRAQAIIKIGGNTELNVDKPVINARQDATCDLPRGTRVFGFCGLGQPEKFRQTLLDLDMDVAGFESFPDHHPYSHAEVQTLHAKAFENKAHLVTTEKDLCRLPSSENIHIVKIKLVFEDTDKLLSLLKDAV